MDKTKNLKERSIEIDEKAKKVNIRRPPDAEIPPQPRKKK